LLRDIFGYALPGGAFLAIGLLSKRFSLSDVDDLLSPYHPPTWAFAILVVGACYIIGDILAAIAYMPISVGKWVAWEIGRLQACLRSWKWPKDEASKRRFLKCFDSWLGAWLRDWLDHNPTEVSSELLEVRSRREKMFSTLDRRETLTILAGATSVALLGGWYVFFREQWDAGTIFRWAGIIVLLQFATGMSHLRRVAAAIRHADETLTKAEPKVPDPDFNKLAVAAIKAAGEVIQATKKVLTT
jgi:hypothetical protein